MVLSWERLGRVGSCRDPQGAGGTEVFPALEHKEERGRSGSRASSEAEAVTKAERKSEPQAKERAVGRQASREQTPNDPQ